MTQEPNIFPYIARLLQGAEVVWKPLGEVVRLEKGKQLNKTALLEEGTYPAYNGGVSFSGFTNTYNYEENTIIISQGGASAGFVNFVTTKFYANAHCYVILPNTELVENRFVYHFLKSNQEILMSRQLGAGIPALRTSEILGIQIPLPPLSVQQEIVRILDKFTQLEAELEAELDCRKRQYEYYRNKLLTFNDIGGGTEIVWKTLGEVLDIYTGGEAPKNLIRGERPQGSFIYPIYSNGEEIYGFTDNYRINKDAVTISSIGAKTGTIYFRKAYFTPIIRLKVLVPKNEKTLNSRYVFHYLSNITISTKRSSVPNINANEVKSIKIPLPPLEEQQRIATILDKFDILVNSISEGLPKEIALRRKQYEYYRERLLSFPS